MDVCREQASVPTVWSEPPIRIQLESVNVISFVWDRKALIKQMLDKTLKKIYAGKTLVFLFLENMPIIQFSTIIDLSTRQPLLLWTESD